MSNSKSSWIFIGVVTVGLIVFIVILFTTLARNPLADCVYGGHVDNPPKHNIFGAPIADCNAMPPQPEKETK